VISDIKYFFNPKGCVANVSKVPCLISLVKLFIDFMRILVDISTNMLPAKIKGMLLTE
jgi:hypothetical protein